MALRRASAETTVIDLGDGDSIEVRNAISKRERNRLIGYFPNRELNPDDEAARLTPTEAINLQTGLFDALVVGWSSDAPCTVEEYLALEDSAADRIDAALAEHFQKIGPTKAEQKAAFRSGRAARQG